VIDDGVDSGVAVETTCSDRSRNENLKKRKRRRSAAVRLIFFQEGLRRIPDRQGVFASGHSSDRSVLLVYPSLVEGRNDGGAGRSLEKRFVRETKGDLAGVDEWLFIAAENIPVIRLLFMEKRNSRMRVSNEDPVRRGYEFSRGKITRNYYTNALEYL